MGKCYAHHKEANKEERLARVEKMLRQGLDTMTIATRLGVSKVTCLKLRREINGKKGSLARRADRPAAGDKIARTHSTVAEIIERAQRASAGNLPRGRSVDRLVSSYTGHAAEDRQAVFGADDPDSTTTRG